MGKAATLLMMSLLGAAAGAAPAAATEQQTYTYTIEHASYGAIGTLSDTVAQDGASKRIDTKLRVAVRILGIVVHREDADRTEIWQNGRLTSFHSVTTVNGTPIEVKGEARPDGFVITSPAGQAVAPADVMPSSPWAARIPDHPVVMMSTKSGRLLQVTALGGEATHLQVQGSDVAAHHFAFITNKRQDVWLDDKGVPVRFRTEEDGSPVDFVLAGRTTSVATAARP